ncbi:MAG: 4Fe-4S dicluster domain-containing protein [Deltaproteobacteria bacterium]|nr:4Fe-4S dicluster domain-containing protein [Deltaproteobacteria bacterium]
MISIRTKKGYKLNIAGEPSHELEQLGGPTSVALLPERIPFVKPRLKVKVADQVKVGSPVFEDKRNPDLVFLSPGGGRITKIDFGPRRVIKEIVVELDQDEGYETFPIFNEAQVENIERQMLVKAIMTGGLPFRDIAAPDSIPPSIIVSLDTNEPFQPMPEVYLKEKIELFEFGIKILQKLSEKLFISTSQNRSFILDQLNSYVTHICERVYPADDPGVLLYHIKKSPDENRAWYINGQDVLLLAMLFKTGKYPVERTVVIGGTLVRGKKHLLTRIGAPLSHLTKGRTDKTEKARHIVGGIFKGYKGGKDSYMGFYETSLVLIPEGGEKEFLGFACHGEERACINCGFCAQVCPVDILPQFTYKCILVDEIEEAIDHGLLDCVECGLCTYVCPSKLELCNVMKNTKKACYLEQL